MESCLNLSVACTLLLFDSSSCVSGHWHHLTHIGVVKNEIEIHVSQKSIVATVDRIQRRRLALMSQKHASRQAVERRCCIVNQKRESLIVNYASARVMFA